MRTIAHLSDLHFDLIDPAVARALIACLRDRPPSLIVVTGDLTQRARPSQFVRARDFLSALPQPQLVLAGNHDIPLFNLARRFGNPLGNFRNVISTNSDPSFEDDELCVAGLNSARPTTWQSGRISSEQWEAACQQFRAADTRAKILATHHPVFPSPIRRSSRVHLPASDGALHRLARSGCDLWLAGHFHHAYSSHTVAGPLFAKFSVPCLQAGTAISRRTRRQPNSFNWIAIDDAVIRWEVRLWDGREFTAEPVIQFPRRTTFVETAKTE